MSAVPPKDVDGQSLDIRFVPSTADLRRWLELTDAVTNYCNAKTGMWASNLGRGSLPFKFKGTPIEMT